MRGSTEAFDLRAALLGELRSAQQALCVRDETQAVHRCRVAIKRARALARLGADGAPGVADVFNEHARQAMKRLGAARDLAALTEAASRAADGASGRAARALRRLGACLADERRSLPAIDLHGIQTGLAELTALAQVWPEPSPAQAQRGAARILARAAKAWKRARGRSREELRHKWRKREKDRYFAALLAGGAWPEGEKRRCKRAQKLGHALGQERDVLMLIERLTANPRAVGSRKTALAALAALDARRRKFASKADRLGAKVHR